MPIYRYRCTCGKERDEFRKIADRDNAPKCCGNKMERRIMPTMIQSDIQPYMSVAIDKETGKPMGIQSRKQHKEFLRRNDYVEVGNDFKPPKRDEAIADAPIFDGEQMKKQGWIEESL